MSPRVSNRKVSSRINGIGVPEGRLIASHNALLKPNVTRRGPLETHNGRNSSCGSHPLRARLLQTRPVANPHRRTHQTFARRPQQLPQRLHAIKQSLPRIGGHDQMRLVGEQQIPILAHQTRRPSVRSAPETAAPASPATGPARSRHPRPCPRPSCPECRVSTPTGPPPLPPGFRRQCGPPTDVPAARKSWSAAPPETRRRAVVLPWAQAPASTAAGHRNPAPTPKRTSKRTGNNPQKSLIHSDPWTRPLKSTLYAQPSRTAHETF